VPREEKGRAIPTPAVDEPAGAATSEVAVFAGGCFWGVQGVYQHVKGVTRAVSGYAGGAKGSASYDVVSGGTSGHAESVQVTFDPRAVSYGTLLQVFFSVAHDPTQRDRQGPDVGTQYRSAIFPASAEQARVAKAYITQLDQARVFEAPIVTTIEMNRDESALLRRRGLPPGLPDAAPVAAVHRLQRPAEDRRAAAAPPGALPRIAGTRPRGSLAGR
jgi:peptide-methionine (S)-S-oxide reductase